MAVTIQGAKITTLSIGQDDTGNPTVQGNYELMSSVGKVLAKQGFNGYNDLKLSASPLTAKLLIELRESIQSDLNNNLGLN